ncbi:hypothetical protein ACS0TY_034755 [Phlomoides rotata]
MQLLFITSQTLHSSHFDISAFSLSHFSIFSILRLRRCLLYFEAQRSGRLPHNQRVRWRHHSSLTDGLEQGVDLVGGYYDAGDNVKFGLPMAYTITLLSWSVIEFEDEISAAAHTHPHVLWAQVGNGDTDHLYWQWPEDMTTSRRAYRVDEKNPRTEVAAETVAAMAAASIVFRKTKPQYSELLLEHAHQLFEFGDKYRGKYDESIEGVKGYYLSTSGYKDELLWGSIWLYKATDDINNNYNNYFNYLIENGEAFGGTTWAITEFSWDVKYAGVQLLAAMLPTEGKTKEEKQTLQEYKSKAEHFLCACLNMNNSTNVKRTPGGLLYTRRWNNMQYVAGALILLAAYSDHLRSTNQMLHCHKGSVGPTEILSFVVSQIEYIMGSNPMGVSYLVGYRPTYPKRVHHRGASATSYRDSKVFVGCMQSYHSWLKHNGSNPNDLVGALVGGPGLKDQFRDSRYNFAQIEACTYNTSPLVGIFAKLHALGNVNELQRGK